MATLLLFVIFSAFIGLGIPDSIFGPAWPAINEELQLPISYANFVTTIISVFTVISSIMSSKVINFLGTGLVTALSTLMTALALLGFSYADNIIYLCLLAIPLGLGAGSIDSALNNYVTLNYKASHMSFLHCFYGIGVAASPFLMSMALSGDEGWRGGYRIVFLVQSVITAITFIAIPLWKRVNKDNQQSAEEKQRSLSIKEIFSIPSLKYIWLIFFASCALEFTCGIWGSSFMINSRGLSTDKAVMVMAFYYGGIAAGRFVSGLIATKLKGWHIIIYGQIIVLAALILLAMPLSVWFGCAALFLVGFGNGPLFPNLTHLTPDNFGKNLSQEVIGTQMAACNIGITLMPPVFGFLAQEIGVELFPYYLIAMYCFIVLGIFLFLRTKNKAKRKIAADVSDDKEQGNGNS